MVDAQGHGIIAAKIASTVHDTFHALMLSELDHRGKTTPELFERINLRLAQSVTARNALGKSEKEDAQEIATMLYGEVRPYGHFRFVNFGHPPPLVFSAEYRKFMEIDKSRMVQFLPLGLQIAEDHPDRNRYLSLEFPQKQANSSKVAELKLMNAGDILFLYTDGVYDGGDKEERRRLESVMPIIACCRQKTCAVHCLSTRSNETIVCEKSTKRIVLTIRQFSLSSEIDECRSKGMAALAELIRQSFLRLRPGRLRGKTWLRKSRRLAGRKMMFLSWKKFSPGLAWPREWMRSP